MFIRPILHSAACSGMTGVGTPELAAAVSNSGGLGIIAIHNAGSPEEGRKWIRRLKTLTDKPFGVNLTILPSMGAPPPYVRSNAMQETNYYDIAIMVDYMSLTIVDFFAFLSISPE